MTVPLFASLLYLTFFAVAFFSCAALFVSELLNAEFFPALLWFFAFTFFGAAYFDTSPLIGSLLRDSGFSVCYGAFPC